MRRQAKSALCFILLLALCCAPFTAFAKSYRSVIIHDTVPVYERADAKSKQIYTAKLADEVVLEGKHSDKWMLVSFLNGTRGFVEASHLPFIPDELGAVPVPTPEPTPSPTLSPTVSPSAAPQPNLEIVKQQVNYSHVQMIKDIAALKSAYPTLVTVRSAGHSVMGRNIPLVIVGNAKSESKVLVFGSMHAREHITTMLIMMQMEYYLQCAASGETYKDMIIAEMLQNTAIYFLPMNNPDGVMLAQQGLNSVNDAAVRQNLLKLNGGSKNFTEWKANINGVDINRNFNAHWNEVKATKPSPLGYKGTAYESEPETQLMVALEKKEKFSAAISYHARGEITYWYYRQAGARLERDLRWAKALSAVDGNALVSMNDSSVPGAGFKDWFLLNSDRPCFTIEVAKPGSSFPLGLDHLARIWSRERDVPLELVRLTILDAEMR